MSKEAAEAAIGLIQKERAQAIGYLTDARRLVENMHNHHFSCRDALEKIDAALDAVSAIKTGG